jgi:hypothetical protein
MPEFTVETPTVAMPEQRTALKAVGAFWEGDTAREGEPGRSRFVVWAADKAEAASVVANATGLKPDDFTNVHAHGPKTAFLVEIPPPDLTDDEERELLALGVEFHSPIEDTTPPGRIPQLIFDASKPETALHRIKGVLGERKYRLWQGRPGEAVVEVRPWRTLHRR